MDITLFHPRFGSTIAAPSSKSHLHRLIVCALLSENGARIRFDGELSDDVSAAVSCARALGALVEINGGLITITPPAVFAQNAVLDCRSSGTVLRFFTAVCAVLGIKAELRYSRQLSSRPLSPLVDVLTENGADIICSDGKTIIKKGVVSLDFSITGNVSSQFVSGLLLACAKTGGKVTLISPLQSADYVTMTEKALADFGCSVIYENGTYTVEKAVFPKTATDCEAEGDWSNSAYALAAGAIGSTSVTVCGLDENSAQGDKKILELLREVGTKTETQDKKITVYPSSFHGFSLSGADIPDIVPPLCVLAACANGNSVIGGVDRLKFKETDRITSTVDLINALGGSAKYDNGCIFISGRAFSDAAPLSGGKVNGANDHRTVMTAALAATVCKNEVTVSDAEAVEKSFPAYFSQFSVLISQ